MTDNKATKQSATIKTTIKVGNIKVGEVYKAKSFNGRILNLEVVRVEDLLHNGRFAKIVFKDKQGTEYIRFIRHRICSSLGFDIYRSKTFKGYNIPLE